MARRGKKRGFRRKMTIPVAVVGGFMPYAMGLWNRRGNVTDMGNYAISAITGYTPGAGWNPASMASGALPILAGVIAHKMANRLGVNRALARTGIPLFRI